MQDQKSEPKTNDKRIRFFISILRRFPALEIISSNVENVKKEERLTSPQCNKFYVTFTCRESSSFKIIPIIDRVLAPYSDKVTLEREIDFEAIIKNRIKTGDTIWTLKCKDIVGEIIGFYLLKEIFHHKNGSLSL